jgi:predicted AlkP superfamily pyrophosphatase or phosphodiesterase
MLGLNLILAALLPLDAVAAQTPRLLLVVSVDQMRGDYFGKFKFTKGFERLRAEGAHFSDAHHAHVPTETGPGHAVILTGKLPAQSGIVGNEWWDRSSGKLIYNMADSVHGTGPENIVTYTLGDAMKAKDPRTKVVGVSLKDRGAITMAGKRADLAVWYEKKKGRAVTSTYYGAPPSWVEKLTAPEAILDSPAGDEFVLKLALEAIERFGLGKDEVTDVLTVSFSSPDYVGHRHGIDGPQLRAQYEALDGVLERLLAVAEKRAGKGRVLVALTADHGVVPSPEDASGQAMGVRRVSWKGFGDKLESELQKIAPAPGRKWLAANVLPNIYLDRALADEMKVDWSDFLDKAAAAAAKLDGVAEVYTSETYTVSPVVRRSYYAGRSGDLIVLPRPAVLFTDYVAGTSHGTPHAYDTHVPVLFWGEGIKPGEYKDKAWVADIAPTLARVLGLDFPPVEGSKVRAEALK